MKKVISVILAVMISLSCLALFASAADSYPVETAFSKNGAYTVTAEIFECDEADYDYYKVWYPAELADIEGKLPVIIFNNSSGMTDNTVETQTMMKAFASWGFIGLTNNHKKTGFGDSASKGLDFLMALAADEESIFYDRIDFDAVGLCGHSQGGSGAFNAASEGMYANSHMFTSICAISAPHSELAASEWQQTPYNISKVSAPAFLIAGTKSDEAGYMLDSGICPLGMGLIANMKAINNDNVVIGRIKDAWHVDTQAESQAYAIAWFMWTLKGDEFAATAFTGEGAELFNNNKWQDVYNKQSENLPENPDPYDPEVFDNSIFIEIYKAFSDIIDRILNFFMSLISNFV